MSPELPTGPLTGSTCNAGTVLSSTTNNYSYSSASQPLDTGYPATTGQANTYFVFLASSVQSGSDLDGTTFPTVTTTYGNPGSTTGYDAYGDVLQIAVATQLGSDVANKTTYNSYQAPDTRNWILGRVTAASTTANYSGTSITRSSSFQYFSNGLLSQEVVEPSDSGSMRLETDYQYDGFGNKTQVQAIGSGGSRTTTTAWEPYKARFAISDTNALSQSEIWSFDERFGLPTQQTGPNGIVTQWSYDGFGRKTSETRFANLADTNDTQISYNFCVPGGCPGGVVLYATSTPMRAGVQNGPQAITYYDMLSRVAIVDVQEFINQNEVCWARSYTVYDFAGRVSEVTRPAFFNWPSSCPTDPTEATVSTYDALGRAYIVTNPNGGTITTGFHGLSTDVTVTLGNGGSEKTTTVKNVLGQTKSITDNYGGTTAYNYDAYGDLLSVTDPAGNANLYYYDTRGRKIFACEPDRVQYVVASRCDGGVGLNDKWSYGYDAFGDVTEQIDANGNNTNVYYDQLGRLTARIESGLASTWTYGTSAANHNVGKLVQTKACTSSSACTGTDLRAERDYSYDDHGRQTSVRLTVSGVSEGSFTTAYNADQGISSVTYPSGFVAQYVYSTYGFSTMLYDGSGNVLWQALARDALQHVTSEQVQNPANASIAIATTRTFDPSTGLVANISANGAPGSAPALTWTQAASPCTGNCWGGGNWGTGELVLANISYSYDLLGKMTERADTATNSTQYFCYDGLNRLIDYGAATSACSGAGNVALSYDSLGNIIYKSDICPSTNCYSYPFSGQPKPHAVSYLTGSENGVQYPTYTYDNNGNMTAGAGRTMIYTAFNMVAQMTEGSNNLCWGYDADHQRVRMDVAPDCSGSAPASTTYYLHDALSGLMEDKLVSGTSTVFTDYLIVGGATIGTRTQVNSNTPTTSFYVLDSQGSVVATTGQTGALLCRISYAAFGQKTASGSGCAEPSREYLGQESINDGALNNLINLNARIYDPVLARFMGADPVIDPYQPQDLNPYSYGMNSPLWLPDPSGLCFLGCFWNQGWFRDVAALAVAVVAWETLPALLASGGGVIYGTTGAVIDAAGEGVALGGGPAIAALAETGAIAGGLSGAITTGSLKGALIGAFQGAAFSGVGDLGLGTSTLSGALESAGLHGLVGGLASAAGGGNFGSGFLAAGFSGLATPVEVDEGLVGGTAIASVVGGVGSVLGGGKFANGAETGAFGYLFNACLHQGCTLSDKILGYTNGDFLHDVSAALDPNSGALGMGTGGGLGFLGGLGYLGGLERSISAAIDALFFGSDEAAAYDAAVAAAQTGKYANKAGIIEEHHIVPMYLGGDVNGPTVELDAAYHQLITNAFRAFWKYGQPVPDTTALEEILRGVYSKYPLPPGTLH